MAWLTLKNLKGDLFGGITAGIVALPLALAFGVSSGLGPGAGLYGAIFLCFFAALFGGTNTQISGPTAPMTAISMVLVAGLISANEGDVTKALPVVLSIFLVVGLLQIILGITGLGKYIKYIPYPVVSGFMTAIGVIIIITQVIPSLGYYAKNDKEYVSRFKPAAEESILSNILKKEAGENKLALEHFKETISQAEQVTPEEINKESISLAGEQSSGVLGSLRILPRALKNINWLELMLSAGTIIIVYGFKKITTKIPSTLVALLVMSLIAYFFHLAYVPIDKIPLGLPKAYLQIFTGFNLSHLATYFFAAVSLAFLGGIDSLLTSVVADNMTKTKHNPNRELIGQGIGNSMAAFFGGLPGAGATIRTVVNINAGGKTRLSGMISAVLILIILLALAPVASQIPAAVLSGILITVGIGVMDYKGLKAIPSMPRSEVIIMLLVLVLSALWNLVYAVGVGLVIACLTFMKNIGDITAKNSQVNILAEDAAWSDEFDFPENLKQEVFIKHVNGPLFFGSASSFQQLAKQIPDTASVVVMRLSKMPYIDQSGLYAMEEVVTSMIKENKKVLFVKVREQPRYMLETINIIPGLVPPHNIFEDYAACFSWIKENVKNVIH